MLDYVPVENVGMESGSVWGDGGLLAELIHKKGSVVKEEGGQMVEDVKGRSRGRFQEALSGVGD